MSGRMTLLALLAAAVLGVVPAGALGAPGAAPAWSVQSLPAPTNFKPGDESGTAVYSVFATNKGGAPTDRSAITITDTLPAGLGVKAIELRTWRNRFVDVAATACNTQVAAEVSTVTCTLTEALPGKEQARLYPDEAALLAIHVAIPPSTAGTLTNEAQVVGGGAGGLTSAQSHNPASTEEKAPTGFQEFNSDLSGPAGQPFSQADGRPYQYTTSFAVNLNPAPVGANLPFVAAGGDLKDVEVALPPGLVANPTASELCTSQQFNTTHGVTNEEVSNATVNECPDDSAVGVAAVQQLEGVGDITPAPIYNLVPPKGMPAQFGILLAGLPVYINTRVRTSSDFGATGYLQNTTQAKRVTAARTTFWGVPADESHDRERGKCLELGGICKANMAARSFLRLPSSCANSLLTTMVFDTWAQPGTGASASSSSPAPTGCALPDFSPTIEAQPSTTVADSPAGLRFNLHIPQQEQEEKGAEVEGEADLRDATVTLPKGLLVNPASADGLDGCSSAQIGLLTPLGQIPPHFSEEPAQCPNAAKVGTVQVITPLLDHPVEGAVFLAKQGDNPFKSLIAIYLALEDPQTGVVAKLAGEVKPDPVTGQLTTVFVDNPQLPVEDFNLNFFAGARASLRTPPACGSYSVSSSLTPWTAPAGADAAPTATFPIDAGPGGPCPSGALAPKLSAGLANPTAGAYSPFSLRLTRDDASAEFAGLTTVTPVGLAAKLAGIPYCPESGISQAASRSQPGQGATELGSASCPAASAVGTTTAGAGAGPSPLYTGGKVYLAGPYKGAPLSFVAIIPAIAGPFDLGVVVNRIAARVNPETAQVTAEADPLPTILAGIPLDVRDIRVDLDRPGFTLAPTNCEPKSVIANVLGVSGATVSVADRFQVGNCAALRFKPKLSLKLSGGTRRNDHPALRAVLQARPGDANVGRTVVTLPPSQQIDNAHIQNPCTRVQFNANQCPPGSVLGFARAFSPLLDKPLEGPVYFRSNGGERLLPDIVADLDGQLHVILVGQVDAIRARLRTTFAVVPDAPVSKFVLSLRSGKQGLLVNNRNICAHRYRANIKMTAQNGRVKNFNPVLKNSCGKKSQGKRR